MPDVGLTTATKPLTKKEKVVIKYSVEVNGLAVYSESYDADKIAEELQADQKLTSELWLRRLEAVVASRERPRFSACLTAFLADGHCPKESQDR